jgi:hypothetical protein
LSPLPSKYDLTKAIPGYGLLIDHPGPSFVYIIFLLSTYSGLILYFGVLPKYAFWFARTC